MAPKEKCQGMRFKKNTIKNYPKQNIHIKNNWGQFNMKQIQNHGI